VSGSYERRSFGSILVLTTRKRGVWARPYHSELHSRNLDYVDFLRDLPRLTSPYNVRVGNRTRCVTAPQRLTTRKRGVWAIEEIRK